jgi:3-deoxy-D-manno-octulosonate 8-phosphate phosphatase (KDO 8-P phosphatase)
MLTIDQLSTIRLIAFDFDGVFTDNTVYVSHDGIESVRCWRSDGLGLSRLRSVGVHAYIISTEVNPVVSIRAKKLRLSFDQGVEDKAAAILSACKKFNIPPEETMFVGNDVNDIPAFKSVTFPVAVADAHPEIYPFVLYRTQKPGGMGAVREICDLVYSARNSVAHGNKS